MKSHPGTVGSIYNFMVGEELEIRNEVELRDATDPTKRYHATY